MKKFISLALVVVVLISSASVFAAQPDEAQLELLKKYGIMVGDPDGDLRLEDTITRAEAAKMIITALNYASAATRTFEKSEFPDVWETHWAKLYINMAKTMGIVEGDEHGNFNPENEVTNEEIVKMLVNVLGYGKMAESMGGYPGGYLIISSQIGLPAELSFVIGRAATRGDVAIMFANALETPLMVQIKWGASGDDEFVILNGENGDRKATILSEYWGVTEEEASDSKK